MSISKEKIAICAYRFCSTQNFVSTYNVTHGRYTRYCSRKCSALDRAMKSKKIATSKYTKGEEKFFSPYGGRPQIWVVVQTRPKLRWKRKAVIILEKDLGRKLTKNEYKRVRYEDGNPENCEHDNITLLPPPGSIYTCISCGEDKYSKKKQSQNRCCPDCLKDILNNSKERILLQKVIDKLEILDNEITDIIDVYQKGGSYVEK